MENLDVESFPPYSTETSIFDGGENIYFLATISKFVGDSNW